MATLPQFQGYDDETVQLLQNKWAGVLNPIIANPLNNVSILKNVKLTSGANSVAHLLQKPLTGWFIVRQRGPASVYDQQDNNQSPQLTLKLISSASVSVDLAVF
jgi:hypothetical protein